MSCMDVLFLESSGSDHTADVQRLESCGHQVDRVANADEAVKLSQQKAYDVLLLSSPEGDTLARDALSALAAHDGCVLVAVTDPSEVERAAEQLLPMGIEYLCREDDGSHLDRLPTIVRDSRLRRRSAAPLTQPSRHNLDLHTLLLGRVAAGMAHDLNNALSGVLGYASLMEHLLPDEDPNKKSSRAISESAERAAKLSGQTLVFAREPRGRRREVHLNSLLQNVDELLRATLPRRVSVELQLEDALLPAESDLGGIMDVLVAVCLRAGEAMKERSATISIRTRNAECRDGGRAICLDVLCPGRPHEEPGQPYRSRGGITVQPIPMDLVREAAARIGAQLTVEEVSESQTRMLLTLPCL